MTSDTSFEAIKNKHTVNLLYFTIIYILKLEDKRGSSDIGFELAEEKKNSESKNGDEATRNYRNMYHELYIYIKTEK